jgi:hypothetical protein
MVGGAAPESTFFGSALGFGVPDLGVVCFGVAGFWPPNSILPIISINGLPPCLGILIPNHISPIFAKASAQMSSVSFRCTA